MTDQLTDESQAEFELAVQRYQAMKDRNAKLEEGLREANAEIVKLQTGLNGAAIERTDLQRRHDQDLAAKESDRLRAVGVAEEANRRCAELETTLRGVVALIGNAGLLVPTPIAGVNAKADYYKPGGMTEVDSQFFADKLDRELRTFPLNTKPS